MSTKNWVNSITTEEAKKIYKIFSLSKTKYATKFNRENEPVNAEVLRKFVRTFLRANSITERQTKIAEGAIAAGMESGLLNFNVK